MSLAVFLQVYLLVHIVFCVLIWVALRCGWLHFSLQMMPIIILVPVAGVVAAVAAECLERSGKRGSRTIMQEDPHLENVDTIVHLAHEMKHENIIPIQEVLRINEAQTRRQMILDIIRLEPAHYIQQLQEACLNSDLEVSHYASTALMELQREYELATQRAESEFSMDPENSQKLCNAIQQMQCYIDSGMINVNTVPVYRFRLEQLLNLQMKILPDDMQARIAAVDNYLALNNFTEARILSDELIRSWPNKEQSWLTRIKVCSVMRDGDELQKTLRAIHYRGVYLSPEGKRIVQFWQNTQREGVGVL